MFHQNKTIFVACLVAALVGVALGQSWNPQSCMQAQQAMSTFTQQMSSSFQELTQQLAAEGNSAFDINGFTEDSSKLMDLYTSLANTDGGIDGGRMMQSVLQIAQQQFKLSQYFMNFQTGPRIISLYMRLTQKMMSNQSNLFQSIVSSCSPSRGSSN